MHTVDAASLPIGDGHPPRIMGVLNVSPESPYAPSVFEAADTAAAYVDETLLAAGADIVDVGLASANRRFDPQSAAAELDRLELAVETIASVSSDAVFSIETRYAEVADVALASGFDMVNDVCGFADPAMAAVCRDHDAAVVKMASPPDLTRPGALTTVDAVYDALERGGLTAKTIVDPAFGRWADEKPLSVDRDTFRRLPEFRALGQPILVSINRKNFLRKPLGRSTDAALPASLAATALAVDRGVHVIRTHDVAETRDAALIGATYADDLLVDRDLGVEELLIDTEATAARYLEVADGDPTVAGTAVTRAFTLTLDESDRSILVERAADIPGVTIVGGDPLQVYLTRVGHRDLRDAISGESRRLDAQIERIADGFE